MLRRPGRTPPFYGAHGEPLTGSVAEISRMRLGGVDQWVMIRGESIANPPLIVLHGGPGFSDTSFLRHFNASLEKSFTVVYWDQRGTGKSFDPAIPRASMTVEQFICDLNELVDAVCTRLGQTKVAILGHSWGSALGVLYAARFPEKVAAYVGCAQIGDWAQGEAASYAFAIDEAQRRGKRKLVEKLRAIGAPPYSAESLLVERTCVSRLQGATSPRALWKMGRMMLGARESSVFELPGVVRAFRFSLETMWEEVSQLNLIELVPALQIPVFFFLGRRDRWVPPETSTSYIDALSAPSKKLVWFEESGHEPFVDEPAKFNALMVELVRPVCVTSAAEISRTEANKALVRGIFDEVNKHDVDGVLGRYAAEYVLHGPPPGISPDLAGARNLFVALFAAFPDAHATIEDLVADGDKVVCRVTFRGTQNGPLLGIPPTGKAVSVTEIYVSRFAAGKCVEEWRLMDELGMLQQLGAIHPGRESLGPAK